ncbi:MAG: NAD+ synthase, partial [Ramlibacter sp.]|nr:NAD+ synthase [Ramlibacter sp.]
MSLSLCVAQLNPTVGDFSGNVRRIVEAARQAHAQGAQLVLTGEMSVCGYSPADLWLRPAFVQACEEAVDAIAAELADLPDLTVVVGHVSGQAD